MAGLSGRTRLWWWAVAGCCLIGLGIRLASVLVNPHMPAAGDAYYYHLIANQLANGVFWERGASYLPVPAQHGPTAFYAPLFPAVLSLASVVGAKSFLAARLWCCVIGTAAVPLAALVGRQLATPRAGLVAALLAAVYPNLWLSDGLALSETLTPVVVLLVLLATYHFWRRPSLRAAVLLGVSVAAAALNHDELALLAPFVLVPIVLLARPPGRTRLRWLAGGVAAAVIAVAPWVGWNLARFPEPVFISDNLGFTMISGDCAQVWNGPYTGYWSFDCSASARVNPDRDEAVQSKEYESAALRFIDRHLSSLPRVTAAKIGRGFALYHPIQQVRSDHTVEKRPLLWAEVGLGMYYGLAVLSIGGVAVLRRRRVPVFPLLAIGVDVALGMAIGFGQTRYRTAFEVSLVLLAAVLVDAVLSRGHRAGPEVGGEERAGATALASSAAR